MNSYYILGAMAVIAVILIIILVTRKKPDYSAIEQGVTAFDSELASLKQQYISLFS